jgi:hypothetical protein
MARSPVSGNRSPLDYPVKLGATFAAAVAGAAVAAVVVELSAGGALSGTSVTVKVTGS